MTTLLEQVREADKTKRTEAAARYRELLARLTAPRDGDAQALAGVLAVLGRTVRDLEADAALVAELDALETAEAAQVDAMAALRAAQVAMRQADTAESERRAHVEREKLAKWEPIADAHEAAHGRAQGLMWTISANSGARRRWNALVNGA